MEATDKDITLIERYFDSELNEEEMKTFSLRIEVDETFKSLVQREKVILGAIRNQGLLDNLQYLKSVEEKIQGNQVFTGRSRNWYYYAAAAVVTIMLAVTFLLPSFEESSDDLFATYFTAYPNVFEATLRGTATTTKRTEAFQAYESKAYKKAVVLFGELLQVHKDEEVLLLLGNSNLMLGEVQKAEENFVTLISEFDNLDIPAKWYLSLCYLKSGETEKARNLLEELAGTDNSYAPRAKELLERVD